MKYKSLKSFTHDQLGAIKEGEEVEATALQATTPLLFGYFEPYETKVIRQVPADAAPAAAKKARK